MRSPVKSMLRDEGGAIAPLYALLLPVLIMSGGIAFDYTRLTAMDTEMQNAADQAALAAASQLDGQTGACDRAINAARNLLRSDALVEGDSGNFTVFSNGGTGPSVTIGDQAGGCAAADTDPIRFYTTADGNDLATNDEAAKFVEITVAARTARYALTPIGSLVNPDGVADGTARAGLGSAVCKVPPLMICNPDPTQPFNADGRRGWGIMVTGHGNDRSGPGGNISAWAPGDFGFLEAGTGNNADLLKALAFQNPAITCQQTETGEVNTGNPQGLYDAINTRFDIYDFSSGNGTTLNPCFSGSCPAAPNVTKDLVRGSSGGGGGGAAAAAAVAIPTLAKSTTTDGSCRVTSLCQAWRVLAAGSMPMAWMQWGCRAITAIMPASEPLVVLSVTMMMKTASAPAAGPEPIISSNIMIRGRSVIPSTTRFPGPK